jgi:PAS domain S-box-containing protein
MNTPPTQQQVPNTPQQSQQVAYYPTQQVIPAPSAAASKPAVSAPQTSMQPPLPPSQVPLVPNALSTSAILIAAPPLVQRPIAPTSNNVFPKKPPEAPIAQRPTLDNTDVMRPPDGKRQLKRAANRRSAQLSRKRKKQYIEELKEENDELRRKEQILMSIPDLIVVFDSAGKLWFVSQSVNRFLDYVPEELEGSSFWNRLCEESVRLLKAAFMDALAARKSDMDTAPLGSGVWELRLVDKDGSHKVVTLNGVVHFSADSPECVCSIRPRDNTTAVGQVPAGGQVMATTVSQQPLSIRSVIKPHQSVIANSCEQPNVSDRAASSNVLAKRSQVVAGQNRPVISDGESGSVISESGSE